MTLVIDPEFQALIPAQSPEEHTQLEANLLAEGCRDALVTWNGVLVDGHNRYEICTRLSLPYNTIEREFDGREDVIAWIVDNQLGRRNLTDFARGELALKKKDAIAAKARKNQANSTGGANPQLRQNSDEAAPIRTDEALAADAGVSRDTIRKIETVTKQAPEAIKQSARSGGLSVNRAHDLTKQLICLPESDRDKAAALCGDEVEKARTLVRLHKSAGSIGSNGTYDEIMATGGFHYGSDLEDWCDFKKRTPREIDSALRSLAEHHKQQARDQRKQERIEAFEQAAPVVHAPLALADIRWSLPLASASVDVILTDPPYPLEYLPLYERLALEAARLLKPGGTLAVMCGQSYLPHIYAMLSQHLTYQWTFAYLTPGGQSAQLWERHVNTFWKPVLWFVKGDYNGGWKGDVSKSDANDKRFHEWGQSESGMMDLVERFSQPGDLILDPFVGGGTTGIAAVALKRRFIGFDLDMDRVSLAQRRLAQCVTMTA